MSFRPMLRPGEGFKPFEVLRKGGGLTNTGRPITAVYKPQGKILGIISKTEPTETDQNKQSGSPKIYHIIQRGTQFRAKAKDVLVHQDGRRFLVKEDPKNPGELGHFLIYKVEERDDLQ